MDKLIYGSKIAEKIRLEVKEEVSSLKRAPHLYVILVGDNKASLSYIKGKEKACAEVGIQSSFAHFDITMSECELIEKIEELNKDTSVDAILVQLPLPSTINELKVLEAIDVNKDVDGFHPMNIGKLSIGETGLVSCTPQGIMYLLNEIGYRDLSGLHVVIMGRSNIVGKPMAQIALAHNATISIVHSKTKHIKEITRMADILIVAVGHANMIDQTYIKEGVCIIDVGINKADGKIYGDVDIESVYDKVSYISPVPKGVGPMTIAMLLKNTVECYRRNSKWIMD